MPARASAAHREPAGLAAMEPLAGRLKQFFVV
jgi:hypothetical protein